MKVSSSIGLAQSGLAVDAARQAAASQPQASPARPPVPALIVAQVAAAKGVDGALIKKRVEQAKRAEDGRLEADEVPDDPGLLAVEHRAVAAYRAILALRRRDDGPDDEPLEAIP